MQEILDTIKNNDLVTFRRVYSPNRSYQDEGLTGDTVDAIILQQIFYYGRLEFFKFVFIEHNPPPPMKNTHITTNYILSLLENQHYEFFIYFMLKFQHTNKVQFIDSDKIRYERIEKCLISFADKREEEFRLILIFLANLNHFPSICWNAYIQKFFTTTISNNVESDITKLKMKLIQTGRYKQVLNLYKPRNTDPTGKVLECGLPSVNSKEETEQLFLALISIENQKDIAEQLM